MPLRFEKGSGNAHDFPLTIGHLFDATLIHSPDQRIVQDDGHVMTYRDLRARVGRLASALHRLGVDSGETVGVLAWDSYPYLEAYFAVPMMGAVIQTVNVRLSPEQIAFTIDHARARVLLVHADFVPLIDQIRDRLPHVRAIIVIGQDAVPDWASGGYDHLLSLGDPDHRFDDFDENAIASTFYTSGTTGLPKAVCFTHRQIMLHALTMKAPLGAGAYPWIGAGRVYMPLTPMFHVHAWGFPYVATMLGVKQVYPGRYDADRILDLRRREGVDFSHCVPTVLQMLAAAAQRRGERLDGWSLLIGGSALTRELYGAATDLGAELLTGYGMSETGPVLTVSRPGTADDRIRTGVPAPLVSVRLVDDHMADRPADDAAHGEIVARAPWLTPCYVGDAEASDALWDGGWLHTRDVATMAADGSLIVRDRLKDVIKSGGEWLCSLTLEAIAAQHPAIAEIAVVGMADDKWGERPVAVVVAMPDAAAPPLAEVNALLGEAVAQGRISRYALFDRILSVDALPRTSVGKIDKKRIRAELTAE
ncbi:long-chain-fatty-acid--CoA ligase [Sphingobium sp.]|uniref:long-chain-fatty-acid--CoA ligase n=1 Tax=Sphingobium sp. TaxID=1912891 RepID=UPI003B3ADB78